MKLQEKTSSAQLLRNVQSQPQIWQVGYLENVLLIQDTTLNRAASSQDVRAALPPSVSCIVPKC